MSFLFSGVVHRAFVLAGMKRRKRKSTAGPNCVCQSVLLLTLAWCKCVFCLNQLDRVGKCGSSLCIADLLRFSNVLRKHFSPGWDWCSGQCVSWWLYRATGTLGVCLQLLQEQRSICLLEDCTSSTALMQSWHLIWLQVEIRLPWVCWCGMLGIMKKPFCFVVSFPPFSPTKHCNKMPGLVNATISRWSRVPFWATIQTIWHPLLHRLAFGRLWTELSIHRNQHFAPLLVLAKAWSARQKQSSREQSTSVLKGPRTGNTTVSWETDGVSVCVCRSLCMQGILCHH